ncbi:hypothetical protein EUTSA_v10029367mg [Eutrema salsugineum]|uniref:Uncharacterized protein n=1 Tax=Eutrema salsugineum TaxID=72664 RepID=V4L3V1_EUTSA|nr:hypothetical protein EUTSA_v10029367mg [Eutrema salsugineum]
MEAGKSDKEESHVLKLNIISAQGLKEPMGLQTLLIPPTSSVFRLIDQKILIRRTLREDPVSPDAEGLVLLIVVASASLGLIAQHLFGAWNEDMRLRKRYREAFEGIKKRTSVVPFAAIFEGRQVLLEDYYKEFICPTFFIVVLYRF